MSNSSDTHRMSRTCIVCGKEFIPHHGRTKICSEECRRLRKKAYHRDYHEIYLKRKAREQADPEFAAKAKAYRDKYRVRWMEVLKQDPEALAAYRAKQAKRAREQRAILVSTPEGREKARLRNNANYHKYKDIPKYKAMKRRNAKKRYEKMMADPVSHAKELLSHRKYYARHREEINARNRAISAVKREERMRDKACVVCGKIFATANTRQLCCSKECRRKRRIRMTIEAEKRRKGLSPLEKDIREAMKMLEKKDAK